MASNLEHTLQPLYDSEIHLTITWIWDGGIQFAFLPYLDGVPSEKWHHVENISELAKALHEAAVKEYPTSGYAKR